MVINKVPIKVLKEDKVRLLKECKDLFLEHHPELKGMFFSHAFMFKKVVDFYLK